MVSEQFTRIAMQFGTENMERLYAARVAVFGIGGVGGYCVEALTRSGIGGIDLIDNDRVCLSNLNRQIIATRSTVGQYKVDIMRERILDINPEAEVKTYRLFYLPETAEQIDLSQYDYVVDAIDTMTAKIHLICRAEACGVPLISCMGAGNKLDPTAFIVSDIYKTSICPVARVLRKELRKRGIEKLKVVYSEEPAKAPFINTPDTNGTREEVQVGAKGRQVPASNGFVPAVAGLIMAGEVIKDMIRGEKRPV